MKIVIAGFGVAGTTAAETARKLNDKASITIVSKEQDLFYYRVRLPEIISGELPLEKIIAHLKNWYEERNIELKLGESIDSISVESKIANTSSGARLPYDKLLLATGADSFKLNIPGSDLKGFFTIRSLKDAWELNNYAKNAKNAVLLGGGILGLEIGHSLSKLGLKVTVMEKASRILPKQTTPESAKTLTQHLTKAGINLVLGLDAKAINGRGKVEEVLLSNGKSLKADVVVMSVGISPTINLAKSINLKTDRAIIVNEYLETSAKDIYAAGDCVQYPNAIAGLWPISRAQGLIAGHNMVSSEKKIFTPEPPSNVLKVAGIDLVAAGNIDPENNLPSVVAQSDEIYRKIVTDNNGLLVGFTNIGTVKGNRELNRELGKKIISSELMSQLKDIDYDFKEF